MSALGEVAMKPCSQLVADHDVVGSSTERPQSGPMGLHRPPTVSTKPTRPLVEGSATAHALHSVWSGEIATVVNAPPGSGKSELLADVVKHLADRAGIEKIVVATPTRSQAVSIAERIAERTDRPVLLSMSNPSTRPVGVVCRGDGDEAGLIDPIVVSTLASCAAKKQGPDVLIVEEAYQATFADVANAAEGAKQILLVGDPGQIGPVVVSETSLYGDVGPHSRAPEVFVTRPDAHRFQIDVTWRLGPRTVEVIGGLYDFEFTSVRPARSVEGFDGELGEIRCVNVASIRPEELGAERATLDRLAHVADLAEQYVGRLYRESTPLGTTVRQLDQGDVAVVLARNAEVSTVSSILAARGLERITVATADKIQGGQWPAVVSLDPMCEILVDPPADAPADFSRAPSQHALSLGRLCVMLSRHMGHLTWVHDDAWPEKLLMLPEGEERARGEAVRRNLCGAGSELAASTHVPAEDAVLAGRLDP